MDYVPLPLRVKVLEDMFLPFTVSVAVTGAVAVGLNSTTIA